jgi:DNA-binding MarR family transcriptional regulator
VLAALSEAGEAQVAALTPLHAECLAALASGMTADEQEILTRLIRKLGREAAR